MKTISDVENQIGKNEITNENNECTTLISLDKNCENKKTFRKYGKIKVLYENNGEPFIVLGPHCKI
jgi:hypothetical protein